MRNGTKKSREEKVIFSLRENETKKSFVSGRSYELFAQKKKRKVFSIEKMKEMRRRGCGI